MIKLKNALQVVYHSEAVKNFVDKHGEKYARSILIDASDNIQEWNARNTAMYASLS